MIGFEDESNHGEMRSMMRSIGMMDQNFRSYSHNHDALADEMEGLLT